MTAPPGHPLQRAEPIFGGPRWQMSYGERAVLHALASLIRPALAIEVGTAEGGSLRRLAAHSGEVHSFDLVDPDPELAELPNVVLHIGDSHVLLPQVLGELAEAGRNIELALVDGDHSTDGVRRDLEDLLASPAVRRTLIVSHDSMNEDVRRGLEAVDYGAHPKVRFVEHDFVPGRLAAGAFANELWGGLSLVVVDDGEAVGELDRAFEPLRSLHELMVAGRERVVRQADEVAGLRERAADADALRSRVADLEAQRDDAQAQAERAAFWLGELKRSASWRVTAPLRVVKGLVATGGRGGGGVGGLRRARRRGGGR